MIKKIDALNIHFKDRLLGKMIISDENRCIFEYDVDFLKDGFSISPFHLPLREGIFTAKPEPFNGLFGVFSDSLPDGWGNLLIDRHLLSKGISPQSLTILDRLGIVGSNGMGAIKYIPDNHITTNQEITDLDFIAKEIEKILEDTKGVESLELLAAKGGSSGGARPKAFIEHKNESWIVKFPSSEDSKNIGEVEYQYSLIAKECGIEMSETELLNNKYFAIKRFDREGAERIHMHSASGLLYASHRFPSLDYIDLIKATTILTKDINEAAKLFRLMVFNIITGNKDDHAKNFSFLYRNSKWMLSPAYDLVPNNGFNGNHSTTINGNGNPKIGDIKHVAKQCGIKQTIASSIFDEVYAESQEIRKVKW